MFSRRGPTSLLLVALLAVLAACAQPATGNPDTAPGVAPTEPYAVGIRKLPLSRGVARPLPTTIWYPAAGPPGGDVSHDSAPAAGRFPLVLLSHGLGGQPEGFADVAKSLAAAGFVIAAPAYPFTKRHSPAFNRNDVSNQPADGSFVLDEIAKLNTREADPFAGHLAPSRMGAAGFSAGGFTTSGMFTADRDIRLRCAIIISAGAMEGGFTGPPVPVLFVHGDQDNVVKYSRGRSAYENLHWPKAFLTMPGQGHGEFLDSKKPGFALAMAAITDFLRWNLYGDTSARDRVPGLKG